MITMYNLMLLFIIPATNIVESHWRFYSEEKIINKHDSNEKIYFPGRTNADEVNFRRLKNDLTSNLISETNSNTIEDEDINTVNDNSSASVTKTVKDKIKNDSSEDTDTRETTTSVWNRKTTNQEYEENEEEKIRTSSSSKRPNSKGNERIPPPSVISSAAANSSLRVCEIKYAEYIQLIFPQESDTVSDANDAEFNGRVLAAPGEYPHMTAVGFLSINDTIDYKCGGSLISENFVITAAHCTNLMGLLPSKVRIGDLNLMVEESFLEPQIRNISKIYVHPNYSSISYYNDIALLQLDKDVELTEFVRPIRLWTEETMPFSTAYAMGYGATAFARERTNRLTNLNMTIVPNEECNLEMPKYPQTSRGILSSQICAKDYVLNRDTCQGDSGGPLQFNIRGRRRKNRLHYHLIGITSYGLYCRSGLPSIFTRVCFYLDWIEHIVWKDYSEK